MGSASRKGPQGSQRGTYHKGPGWRSIIVRDKSQVFMEERWFWWCIYVAGMHVAQPSPLAWWYALSVMPELNVWTKRAVTLEPKCEALL